MRYRLFLILSLVVLLLPLISPLLPTQLPILSADSVAALDAGQDAAAKKYCDAAYPAPGGTVPGSETGTGLACWSGYIVGYAISHKLIDEKPSQEEVCEVQHNYISSYDLAACQNGYDEGLKTGKPGSASTEGSEVANACSTWLKESKEAFASCKQGFKGQQAKKTEEQSCKNASNQEACSKGYEAAGGRINPNDTQTAAEKYCKNSKGSEKDACIAGYTAALSGDTNKLCESSAYSDTEKDACNTAFTAAGGNGEEDTKDPVTCETPENAFGAVLSLTWIVCPVVNGMEYVIQKLDSLIFDLLAVGTSSGESDPNRVFCDSNTPDDAKDDCKSYKAAWASFRNIALGFLVITALIIVISQAIGTEVFDAYTVRKMLPRLLVVAIGVTLSWELMQFFVQLTNEIGYGIRFLINQPFASAGIDQLSLDGNGRFAIGLIGAGALAALGPLGLLSFAATAGLAVFVAFLTLMLREIAIIIMVIIAPIAIVAYVLPNTQRVYKMWWESFAKALLMFPLIIAFITVGRVFSAVADDTSTVGQLFGFAAYFAPYFMIPLTFRFAGATMGAIGGAVQQRTQGLQQGVSNYRANQRKQRFANAGARIQSGNAFKRAPTGSVRHRLNRGLAGATKLNELGPNPANWRTNMRTAIDDASTSAVDKFSQENASFGAWSGDDAKLAAARFDNRQQIGDELARFDSDRFAGAGNRAAREEAISQIMRTKKQVDNGTFHKARIEAQSKTGTGYQDANGNFDSAAVMDDINHAYGSDRNGAGRALGKMRGNLQQSGQMAGAAGFGTWAAQMEALHNGSTTRAAAHAVIMDEAIDAATPGQKIYGKPSSARAFAQAQARRIQTIADEVQAGNATEDDLSAAVAEAAGVYDAMSQAAPGNASEFANGLMDVEIQGPAFTTGTQPIQGPNGPLVGPNGQPLTRPVTTQPRTIREYVQSQMNGNDAFVNRRRDISQSSLERAAAEQQARARQATPGASAAPPTGPPTGPPSGPI